MTSTNNDHKSARPPDPSSNEKEEGQRKDFWDKVKAAGPMFVAIVGGIIGGWYNLQQTSLQNNAQKDRAELEQKEQKARAELEQTTHKSEVWTSLVAQRERADSDLRAAMFKTLFDAYFGGSVTSKSLGDASHFTSKTPDVAGLNLDDVHKQTLFLNLMVRNFDTIDIKPVFLDLDEKLGAVVGDVRRTPAYRAAVFEERERLRKVAGSVASQQVRALASLPHTTLRRIFWRNKNKNCDKPQLKPQLQLLAQVDGQKEKSDDGEVTIDGVIFKAPIVADGRVLMKLDTEKGGDAGLVPFTLSFYDLPFIDNTRLASEVRLALVLDKYISYPEVKDFIGHIKDPQLRESYMEAKDSCWQAAVRVVKFPVDYMGLRDRPYLDDVVRRMGSGKETGVHK